jgi:hypothetical protein
MKKIFIITLFVLLTSNLIFAELTIVKKDSPIDPKGSKYFPLFVGEKWVYTVSQFDTSSDISWEIISYNEISDISKNMSNLPAYEVFSKETSEKWYFIEYDGFICSLELTNDGYSISRIFPINPQLEDKWLSGKDNYTVTEIKEMYARTDFQNEELKQSGYQIYSKDTGLQEIYQKTANVTDNSIMSFKLKNYVAFEEAKQLLTAKNVEPVINENPAEISSENNKSIFENKNINLKSNTIVENENPAVINQKTKNYSLSYLDLYKSYIQVSSFKYIQNANNYLFSLRNAGYDAYIYQDIDNLFKILIEFSENEQESLIKIKKEIDKKAFVKQRKK